MQPYVRAGASASAYSTVNDRGQYGDPAGVTDAGRKDLGVGGVLLLLGVSVGIYALSPGARHWYKHGYLPPVRR